ncbi:MAG: hypothetical protein Q7S13_02505 [Candidatus Omnitrophota bacterium]|jgi:hypothetical protein|nr:hypothetical protein [Candidatus Omnitrophota bacterium]
MQYSCSVCQQKVNGDLIQLKDHTERHIAQLIKHDHPEWQEKDGVCAQCLEYYRAEIAGSIFKDAPCAIRIRKGKKIWSALTGLFGASK